MNNRLPIEFTREVIAQGRGKRDAHALNVAPLPSVHQRGIAMLIVLVVIAMATILGTAFMSAQTTTTGITKNLEDQAVARQIAESGLILMRNKIQSDDTWRTGRTQGIWVNNQSLGQGTFTVEITDADGDPSNNQEDAFTLTVTGKFGDVSHVVRSYVQPFGGAGQAGLLVEYFHSSSGLNRLSDIDWNSTPNHTEVVPNVDRANSSSAASYDGGPVNRWGARYSGYITIPTSGLWTLYTASDDGSNLSIDGDEVVDNDGNHSWRTKSSTVSLDAGKYAFETLFYENGGSHGVIAYWQGPGVSKEVIPASAFTRDSDGAEAGGASGENDVSISTKTTIRMFGNSSIDAYQSHKGPYGGSNQSSKVRVSTNGILPTLGVTMSDNATIHGKLMIKPLLPILPVVTWSNSEITDGVGYLSGAVDIPDVSMPNPLPSNSGSLSVWSGTPEPITEDKRYSSLSLGGNAQLAIQGDVTIVCHGNFSMGGTSQLIIPNGSTLKLYVSGSFNTSSSAVINAATNEPGRLEIFMTGNNKDIQLNNSVQLAAYIYNPEGGLKMYGTSQFYGRFAGETLDMSDSPQIHGDGSTGNEAPETTASSYVFAWDEGL